MANNDTSTSAKKRQKRALYVGLVFGLVALAYFVKGVNWQEIGDELKQIHLGWVAVSVALLLAEFAIRSWRWKILLRPVGKPTAFHDLFIAQVIGAACNTLLPLRAGEIVKPMVAARRTQQAFSTMAATAVMERVYDILGMVSVLCIMVLVLPSGVEAMDNEHLVSNLKLYGGLFGAFAATCMAVFFVLASQEDRARNLYKAIISIAPKPIQNKLLHLFDGFVQGLANTRDRRGFWEAGCLSVVLWFNGALAIFCLFKAFGMSLGMGAACFVGVAIALTVALPQAPGFIGVFHIAIEKTLELWDQDTTPSKSFAIVFWAVSFIPITAVGLVSMWREGLDIADLHSASNDS